MGRACLINQELTTVLRKSHLYIYIQRLLEKAFKLTLFFCKSCE